ncbi:MAG: hypothetical protein WAV07_09620 [Candidatus Contendobacter sp.]
MEIRVQTSEELTLLLSALAQEIVDANIYHRLFCDVVDSIAAHEHEFRQSNTFWSLTIDALRDARLTHLCRVYDQESNSLNLVNLLQTLKANLQFFNEASFRERLKGNAFVDSLADQSRIPDMTELDADIESASCRNPIVKKLMIWRNNLVAHRGAKAALGKNQVLRDNALSQEEIEQLLDHSFKTFNKYSSLYQASTWSRQVIGHDDYKSLLKFLGLGLDKWDEDIEHEISERVGRVERSETRLLGAVPETALLPVVSDSKVSKARHQ